MRTRIALVAIVPIALITVTLLGQLVSVQPARAANATPVTSPVRSAHDQLTSDITSTSKAPPPSTGATSTVPAGRPTSRAAPRVRNGGMEPVGVDAVARAVGVTSDVNRSRG